MPTRNKGRRTRVSPRVSLRKSVVTGPRSTIEVGRNDPCPCGSGEKYKNCCVSKGDQFLRKLAKEREKAETKVRRKEQGGFLSMLFKRIKNRKAS